MTQAIQADARLPDERQARTAPWWSSRSVLLALLLALVVAAISGSAAALAWSLPSRAPADDSADAGFARDMADHHSQAVEMALIALGRTEDPAIRTLATDILLTQQAQIGMMRGWLDVWGLPATGWDPRMAWMGHAMEGPMPGMATREEIASLRDLPREEADRRFLKLMIRHHEGGVEMAQAGVELGEQPVVRGLAEAILRSQQAEVTAMEDLLRRE
jgi:uncharacterized protein (DUF305 family)